MQSTVTTGTKHVLTNSLASFPRASPTPANFDHLQYALFLHTAKRSKTGAREGVRMRLPIHYLLTSFIGGGLY